MDPTNINDLLDDQLVVLLGYSSNLVTLNLLDLDMAFANLGEAHTTKDEISTAVA